MGFAERVAAAEAEGFRVVQRGRIIEPRTKATFADRAEGCRVGWIASGDRLFDDDKEWVHMRRKAEDERLEIEEKGTVELDTDVPEEIEERLKREKDDDDEKEVTGI